MGLANSFFVYCSTEVWNFRFSASRVHTSVTMTRMSFTAWLLCCCTVAAGELDATERLTLQHIFSGWGLRLADDPCETPGIACVASQVRELSLPDQNLAGKPFGPVGRLRHLEYLDLDNTGLVGNFSSLAGAHGLHNVYLCGLPSPLS